MHVLHEMSPRKTLINSFNLSFPGSEPVKAARFLNLPLDARNDLDRSSVLLSWASEPLQQ